MKVNVKFDMMALCRKILEDQISEFGRQAKITSFGEIEFAQKLTSEELKNLAEKLSDFHISIIENQKTALVQKVKDAITDMVRSDEQIQVKASIYLSEKLGHSYGYISNVFSDVTHTSIENFIILQKIDYAKQLLLIEKLSLTEIANKLRYSSVAHLSAQFKNTTGITPSQFQKIINQRKSKSLN